MKKTTTRSIKTSATIGLVVIFALLMPTFVSSCASATPTYYVNTNFDGGTTQGWTGGTVSTTYSHSANYSMKTPTSSGGAYKNMSGVLTSGIQADFWFLTTNNVNEWIPVFALTNTSTGNCYIMAVNSHNLQLAYLNSSQGYKNFTPTNAFSRSAWVHIYTITYNWSNYTVQVNGGRLYNSFAQVSGRVPNRVTSGGSGSTTFYVDDYKVYSRT